MTNFTTVAPPSNMNTSTTIGTDTTYLNMHPEEFSKILQVLIGLHISVAVSGVAGNILNIRAFYVLGLNDGVTVSFFALSVTDLLYCCASLLAVIFNVLIVLEMEGVTWFPTSPDTYLTFGGNVAFVAVYMSMSNVTFIAVARCLCVALPFKFKDIFTTSRSVVFIMFSCLLPIAAWSPIFANMGVQCKFDARRNTTRIFLWVSADRERIKDIVYFTFDTVISLLVQVILLICVVILTVKLRESAKLRNSHGNQTNNRIEDNVVDSPSPVKLSPRDLRVVHQVILISVIYLVTSLVKIFNAVFSLAESEFDVGKGYHYLYFLLGATRGLFDCVNASSNFFVYFTFNTSFRAACFCQKEARGKTRHVGGEPSNMSIIK